MSFRIRVSWTRTTPDEPTTTESHPEPQFNIPTEPTLLRRRALELAAFSAALDAPALQSRLADAALALWQEARRRS